MTIAELAQAWEKAGVDGRLTVEIVGGVWKAKGLRRTSHGMTLEAALRGLLLMVVE